MTRLPLQLVRRYTSHIRRNQNLSKVSSDKLLLRPEVYLPIPRQSHIHQLNTTYHPLYLVGRTNNNLQIRRLPYNSTRPVKVQQISHSRHRNTNRHITIHHRHKINPTRILNITNTRSRESTIRDLRHKFRCFQKLRHPTS